jgi:hypothetical protein
MVMIDGWGIPTGSTLSPASPAEFKLAKQTLERVKVPRKGHGRPKKRLARLIADKAFDNPLHKRPKELKIALIAPHRKNRTKMKKQDEKNSGNIGNGGKLNVPFPSFLIFAAYL